ncbi:MAG: hypothetical protein ACXVIS_07550 [Halobacteriota archaeon]
MSENDPPPQNVKQLQKRLHDLGVTVSTRTLTRWAKQGLIPPPDPPRGRGRGKGSVSVWPQRAICMAAGVWILRNGSGKNWSRRKMDHETVKNVQRVASEMYKHPTVLLSLPTSTLDEDDPPLSAVHLMFRCAPKLEPFLFPYLVATEKARRSWSVKRPAVITFEWAYFPRATQRAEETVLPFSSVKFVQTSAVKAPNGPDRIQVLVDGADIRGILLTIRRNARILQATLPDVYKQWRLDIPKDFEVLLAAKPIRIGAEDTFEKTIEKYKRQVPESELRTRLAIALYQEEHENASVQKSGTNHHREQKTEANKD